MKTTTRDAMVKTGSELGRLLTDVLEPAAKQDPDDLTLAGINEALGKLNEVIGKYLFATILHEQIFPKRPS